MTPDQLLDILPSMKYFDGKEYHPTIQKDCDGYISAYYMSDDGDFKYRGGAYPTLTQALAALVQRVVEKDQA